MAPQGQLLSEEGEMKPIVWEKVGRIIVPEEGPAWRQNMSGAMHVMPLENDRYRVYLTGVGNDIPSALGEPGRRQIGWLELDRDFNIVYENPDNPVLTAGEGGAFDCEGVVMPMIVRLSPNRHYMYYAGFGPGTGCWLDNHVGLAISRDRGNTWTRWSRAHLPVRDDQDPFSLGTVWVIRETGDRWRIWYTAARSVDHIEGRWHVRSHIKYATSPDGIHWDKPANNVVLELDTVRGEQLLTRPMIVREPDGYRMWYCVRTNACPYYIGYAESRDGRHWDRKPSGIRTSTEGWDSEIIEYPCVLKEQDRYLMFYNGNGYGRTGTGLAIGRPQ